MGKFLFSIIYIMIFSSSFLRAQNVLNEKYERHWESGYEKVRIISYNIFNGFVLTLVKDLS